MHLSSLFLLLLLVAVVGLVDGFQDRNLRRRNDQHVQLEDDITLTDEVLLEFSASSSSSSIVPPPPPPPPSSPSTTTVSPCVYPSDSSILESVSLTSFPILQALNKYATASKWSNDAVIGFELSTSTSRAYLLYNTSMVYKVSSSSSAAAHNIFLLNGEVFIGAQIKVPKELKQSNPDLVSSSIKTPLSFTLIPEIHSALRSVARSKGLESIGYYLCAESLSFQAAILNTKYEYSEQDVNLAASSSAPGTQSIYLFKEPSELLGCFETKPTMKPNQWQQSSSASSSQQQQYAPFFRTVHQVLGTMSRRACSMAASKIGHSFFAIQGRHCSSTDKQFNKDNRRPSMNCTLMCHNGVDNCGGTFGESAMVFSLPSPRALLHRQGYSAHLFHLSKNTTAVCEEGAAVKVKENIFDVETARTKCLDQIYPKCQGYLWSSSEFNMADKKIKANSVVLCSKPLKKKQKKEAEIEVGRRLREYNVFADASNGCYVPPPPSSDDDSSAAPLAPIEYEQHIIPNVTSSSAARMLCDSIPNNKCTGYVWTGPIGIGSNSDNLLHPTPFMALLCEKLVSVNTPKEIPGSGYEFGVGVQDYFMDTLSSITSSAGASSSAFPLSASCSSYSFLGRRYEISSSLQARSLCDSMDGKSEGVPGSGMMKCIGYKWNSQKSYVDLCSAPFRLSKSVENTPSSSFRNSHVEIGNIRPESCEQISNRFFLSVNNTDAIMRYTPSKILRLYKAMNCTSSPSSCQSLSDFYSLGLVSGLSTKQADRIPGSIRELWLSQNCSTTPSPQALDRNKPAFLSISRPLDEINTQLDSIERKVKKGLKVKKESKKQELQDEIMVARMKLQSTIAKVKKNDS